MQLQLQNQLFVLLQTIAFPNYFFFFQKEIKLFLFDQKKKIQFNKYGFSLNSPLTTGFSSFL